MKPEPNNIGKWFQGHSSRIQITGIGPTGTTYSIGRFDFEGHQISREGGFFTTSLKNYKEIQQPEIQSTFD